MIDKDSESTIFPAVQDNDHKAGSEKPLAKSFQPHLIHWTKRWEYQNASPGVVWGRTCHYGAWMSYSKPGEYPNYQSDHDGPRGVINLFGGVGTCRCEETPGMET